MQKSLGALEAGFTPGMFEASRIQAKMKTNLAKVKDSKISHKIDLKHIWLNNNLSKAIFDHYLQERKRERSFGGRFNSQPQKFYCVLCGENKSHTKKTYQITIQKQKELVVVVA
jgi:hypothetical protein